MFHSLTLAYSLLESMAFNITVLIYVCVMVKSGNYKHKVNFDIVMLKLRYHVTSIQDF